MSDSSTLPDSSTTSDSSTTQPSKPESTSSRTRSFVLLAILAVLLIALAFDYLVARPRVDEAYDAIAARSVEVNATANEILTDEDIHELLGKEPSRTFTDGNETVEVFSWASGVPFRTHDLFVVYQQSRGQQMFRRHSKFVYDESGEVMQQQELQPPPDEELSSPAAIEETPSPADQPPAGEEAAEEEPAEEEAATGEQEGAGSEEASAQPAGG